MTKLKINQNCFLWHNITEGIFYNANKGNTFRFRKTPEIQNDCNKIDDINNLYSISINVNFLNIPEYEKWIKNLIELQIAELIPNETNNYDRISLPPVLKINKDIRKYQESGDHNAIESELLTYLHEVSFHFGEDNAVEYLFKQISYPICYKFPNVLALNDIKKTIQQITSINLKKINLIGANIFLRNDLTKVLSVFNSVDVIKTIIITDSSFATVLKFIPELVNQKYKLQIICAVNTDLSEIEKYLLQYSIDYSFVILISSENDYKISIQKYNDIKTENCYIKPIYKGDNLNFFQKNIFISSNDIMYPRLSKRAVFANQVLNSNFFGKLTVMPDGEIYANVNHNSLGNIKESTIYDMLGKEMDSATSWLLTRDKVKPCSECLYRYLCPPLSNYELVLEKPNLCVI